MLGLCSRTVSIDFITGQSYTVKVVQLSQLPISLMDYCGSKIHMNYSLYNLLACYTSTNYSGSSSHN